MVDFIPHNMAMGYPVQRLDYGDRRPQREPFTYPASYSSLKRGSWDYPNVQRSRNSLPSSMSYQHMATLPRGRRHPEGDRNVLNVCRPHNFTTLRTTNGIPKNVTFDMTSSNVYVSRQLLQLPAK